MRCTGTTLIVTLALLLAGCGGAEGEAAAEAHDALDGGLGHGAAITVINSSANLGHHIDRIEVKDLSEPTRRDVWGLWLEPGESYSVAVRPGPVYEVDIRFDDGLRLEHEVIATPVNATRITVVHR